MPIRRTKISLLLTGAINTKGKHFCVINDKAERKKAYCDAITYYLTQHDYTVVFVENSNEDISDQFTSFIEQGRLEVLTFDGNDYPPEKGKSPGEMNCIMYALKNSTVLQQSSFIFKITGRYVVKNLNAFVKQWKQDPTIYVMADFRQNLTYAVSSIFGFVPEFGERYLFKYSDQLDDERDFYFERGLAKAILNAVIDNERFTIFKYYAAIDAEMAYNRARYNSSPFYVFPRNILYWIRHRLESR